MIAKFDGIIGDRLANLLQFIHSKENLAGYSEPGEFVPEGKELMVVRVKAINPDNQADGTSYGLTLEVLEWLPKGDHPRETRVDPKYFLRVYKILGLPPRLEDPKGGQLFYQGNRNFPIHFEDGEVRIYTNLNGDVFVLRTNEGGTTVRLTPKDTGFEVVGQRGVLTPGAIDPKSVKKEHTFII
jgi:hypothetical protein